MSRPIADDILMPRPRRLETPGGPPLVFDGLLRIRYVRTRSPRLERAVERFANRLGQRAESDEAPAGSRTGISLSIDCAGASGAFPHLAGDESHTIHVASGAMHIVAAEEWGVLRALATLRQLCTGFSEVAPVRIVDSPRFPWRGLMLDVARHFIPLADLERTLDAMAVFKLNVLHLHLSDDQAFRFPSRRYPRLPSPEHYSAAELGELVTAAADRGIRVVPELDVPGHTTSWLTAYPDWGNRPAEASRRFGVHPGCLDPTRREVLEAVEGVFAELAAVFPDSYLHIGGDEVHHAWWTGDERIRRYMRDHGLADAAALQATFNRHMARALARLGRRTLAWDEALHPQLPAAVTVQAWRGATARDRALLAGHDCVVSAPYYLDLFFPCDAHYRFDPAAPERELVAAEDALLEDPRFAHVAAGLAWTRHWRDPEESHPAAAAGRLLGAEACLWSELVDVRVLDVRLWSRMPVLAERFWSPAEHCDPASIHQRLERVIERLPPWAGVDVLGDYRRLSAQAGVTEAWRPLADMLEPVKWYGRLLGEEALRARLGGREMPQARPYHADTPLDRVVDALPPESFAARRLAAWCREEAAGDHAARARLRDMAETWRALPARGGPPDLEDAARRLRSLGDLLQAVLGGGMDQHEARRRLSDAAAPCGEYVLAPVVVLMDWIEQRVWGSGGQHGRD